MANPRRNSQSSENPFHSQSIQFSSSLVHFLKKPHAFPFLLSIFLLLTWVSLRLQHSSYLSSAPSHISKDKDKPLTHKKWSQLSDSSANLIRFSSGFPSRIAKDKRGWLLDPISLALASGISGTPPFSFLFSFLCGAVSCVSIHLGEIQPGGLRGNHRHHTCNETFVIWGAETKFRLENHQVDGNGYAEVTIGADEVAVASSPSGTAHALINIDPHVIGSAGALQDYK
ncbi:unnamed protein product [Prunus armeniaca]|uniref:Uncharacterized protein n=1 Tax=Prunus armeniaca TaxID=36596 RepID=A0A6J5XS40_PRUAR|nr:unnamed protein product [Prunus armeniaca]